MRVAMVCGRDDPARDGVADYVSRLAGALAGQGVTATLVPAVPAGTLSAARRIARLRPDLVHVQFAPSAYGWSPAVGVLPWTLSAATRARPPLVTTLHEYGWWSWPPRIPARSWRWAERTGRWDRETLVLAPASDVLVVTNRPHRDVVSQRLGRTPVMVPIGPNVEDAGLSRDRARAVVRMRWGVPVDARLLVFFGFVHPVKGVRYLVEALPELRRRHGDVRVVVAGGFTSLALPEPEARDFRTELAARASAAGVSDAVAFTGHVPAVDVSALLRASDAVVQPLTAGVTTRSGALLAAFAHGAPVAATAADPADPEVVDGTSVVTIPRVRDAAAVIGAVDRLLGDADLARRVAAGGRRVAADRSWARIAQRHAELYRDTIGRRG